MSKYISLYWLKRTPVVIYQMGKVGSTSIAYSLQNSGDYLVFQIHTLRRDTSIYLSDKLARRIVNWLHRHIVGKRQKTKYITLTRDPIAVNIGWFFQNLHHRENIDISDDSALDKVLHAFYTDHIKRQSKIILNWFDNEFFSNLGINVYDYSFPIDKGYLRIETDTCDVLILQLEIEDELKARCLRNFLEIDEFDLKVRNVGDSKDYADLYRAFLAEVSIPQAMMDQHYNSKLMQHFYTQDQINNFRAKWMGKS